LPNQLSAALGAVFFSCRGKKFTTERTETTEKSTSARASRDYKVTVLLTHSVCLHLFSVIPQGGMKSFLGCGYAALWP
jgi:hypothetical protein